MATQITKILNEVGINRAYDGWRKPIHTDGPPGLTHFEQEMNRKGGYLYGSNAVEALQTKIDESRDWLMQFEGDPDDEVGDEVIEERDWLRRAEEILKARQAK